MAVVAGTATGRRIGRKVPRSNHAKPQRRPLRLGARRSSIFRKHGSGSSAARRVRKALNSCEPDNRCLSGACPVCMRAFQRWFVHAADEFIRSHPASEAGGFKAVSLVPSLIQMEQDDE